MSSLSIITAVMQEKYTQEMEHPIPQHFSDTIKRMKLINPKSNVDSF